MKKSNLLAFVILALFNCISVVSCQEKKDLEYGKLTDLAQIDWEKQNLDSIFSKLVYNKEINYKKTDTIYQGNQPLKIQWYFNFNADSTLVANKIDDRHYKIINKGDYTLTPIEIYRNYFAFNDNLTKKGSFGYYKDKSIIFSKFETISSGKDDLALIRFNNSIEKDSTQSFKQYNALKDILSKEFKEMDMSIDTLNLYPYYEWKTKNKKITLKISKGIESKVINGDEFDEKEIFTIFLEIIYYNEKTKNLLKGIY